MLSEENKTNKEEIIRATNSYAGNKRSEKHNRYEKWYQRNKGMQCPKKNVISSVRNYREVTQDKG